MSDDDKDKPPDAEPEDDGSGFKGPGLKVDFEGLGVVTFAMKPGVSGFDVMLVAGDTIIVDFSNVKGVVISIPPQLRDKLLKAEVLDMTKNGTMH